MKTSSFLAALCCLLPLSCTLIEPVFPGAKTKDECRHRPYDKDNGLGAIKIDTSIFFSAVIFEENYDWFKDQSYGLAPFRLVLYKDFQETLSIDSRSGLISSNPDTHHIIGGRLYTEYNTEGHTIICKDGVEILRLPENGTLKGILEEEEETYTLFQEKFSNRICLRKGSDMIFEAEDGTVFGDLSDPSYFPSGALYKDKGKICFCYSNHKDGLCYSVIAGLKESGLAAKGYRSVLDIKVVNGDKRYAYDRYGSFSLRQARVWKSNLKSSVCGLLSSVNQPEDFPAILVDESRNRFEKICDIPGTIYRNNKYDMVISETEGKALKIYDSSSGGISDFENTMMMSPSCAFSGFDGIYLALSPRSCSESPFIMTGEKRKLVDIHGYISCLKAYISLPTSTDGYHLPELQSGLQESLQEEDLQYFQATP